MLTGEFGLAQDLVAEFPSALHDSAKHLIVVAASEENLACVQLEKGTTDGPYVDTKVVRHSEDCPLSAMSMCHLGREAH